MTAVLRNPESYLTVISKSVRGCGDKETGHGMSWTRKVEKRRNRRGEAVVQGGKRAANGRGLGLAAKRERCLENNIIWLFFFCLF